MIKTRTEKLASQEIEKLASKGNIPAAYADPFVGGIDHPEVYLWDVWSSQEGTDLHLYCLAVSRKDEHGKVFPPELRNQRSFHIRHFISRDDGQTWTDQGCFQKVQDGAGKFDSKSIWSGSILSLADGRQLTAYTGIREQGPTLLFQQSLGLSISADWQHIIPGSQHVISDPLTDWHPITELGYFLGELSSLGHKDGEADGPILAWRDPFLFHGDGEIHLFWSAKMGSRKSALGHAILSETESGFEVQKMYPPVAMPDGDEYTQLELPKILHDDANDRFLLLVSSCNRLHERQSDEEADKRMRLYQAKSLEGPWHKYGHQGSTLELAEAHMFGVTIVSADFSKQMLRYVAPYTAAAGPKKFLTLSETHSLDLRQIDQKAEPGDSADVRSN
ncbi:MAG: hypothetical protein HKN85_06090 [Gammaproteobacteria bacterium]|nr:hypothetical protein [Gammaproteobacteria bacterium]